jgi:hypothetical protein
MIPKVIHYCWFGRNPKPKLAEKCIKSWKKYCPDYEIVEWNEDNFDISQCGYCQEAYEEKKWAFVTDYARLKILYDHGGFYFDTDVELRRPLDPLLEEQCFMGIENSIRCLKVNTGLGIGAEPGFPLIGELEESYKNAAFRLADGTLDTTTCTVRNTEILKAHGYVEENRMQTVAGATIYPTEYFSPMVMENEKMQLTNKTISIHHYSLSWTGPERQALRKKNLRKYRRDEFFYHLKVLPNNILLTLLGEKRYVRLKKRFKK